MEEANKLQIPEETSKDSQEHIDAMVKKADEGANTTDIDTGEVTAPAKEEAPKVEEKILGKFNSQEELIKSYQELEKKIGQPKEEDQPLTAEPKADGLKGIDFSSVQNEFEENGELSEATIKSLEDSGLPKSYVDNYIEGIKAVATKFEAEAHESVGGKEEYGKMIDWVQSNLSETEIQMFNEGIDRDNQTAIYTIKGMAARYRAETTEPSLTVGETGTATSGLKYESMAQVKTDMSNPKYANDPAFRKQVEEKLARSTII
ncbi:hypothetical protein N9T79_00050 [Candidatus Pelagibacter sp.]|nr:hypothetical protein [Candidatus Pelagibacter sp.]